MSEPVLSVNGLTTVIRGENGAVPVVPGVSFEVMPGETVGLVGESGSGKSMTMLSVMGLHPRPPAEVVGGEVVFEGVDLAKAPDRVGRPLRGAKIAMVYQDPMTSLNPLMRIGHQIAEVLTAHGHSRTDAQRRTRQVLAQVGIPRPERAMRSYPHEFSGGMRQRVVIAMALALKPRLLIADEPTTALDVTIQQQIIELISRLQEETGMAVVWITHDLGVVARVADRVLVMYAGHIVEEGPIEQVFRAPQHPYTAGLIAAIPPVLGDERPPLRQISGAPPDPAKVPAGCPFHPRCPEAVEICAREMPPTTIRNASSRAACWVPPEEWKA